MLFWETDGRDSARPEHEREFADVWGAMPKYVFSRSLEAVEGNTILLRGELGEEVRA